MLLACLMKAPKNHRPGSHFEAVEQPHGDQPGRLPQHSALQLHWHRALALSVGKSAAGLPVSLQLVGRFFNDPLLLRIAHAYQHATDWGGLSGSTPDRGSERMLRARVAGEDVRIARRRGPLIAISGRYRRNMAVGPP